MVSDVPPPKRTGKSVESLYLDGYHFPWRGMNPVFLRIPGSEALYLPCFSDVEDLKKEMALAEISYESVKTITNGGEFLDSVPRKTPEGEELIIILNPRRTPKGTTLFTQVLRN